ncbi:hypothetical protein E4T42_02527 [Aureobasidium subglaciale]|nr:hypothetical protein E4T42_02527 [Aureobasidium subglaciale]
MTTVSLLRLISGKEAVTAHNTVPKPLAPAQTSIIQYRVPSLNNHASSSSLTEHTKISSPCTQSSTSLLDLYLLESSSCLNAGIDTLPSTAIMDGQVPGDKGRRISRGSATLSTVESLLEAYAASQHSEASGPFIHAGDLDRQSYIDARMGVSAVPRPLFAPGPAPSLLPPSPAHLPAPPRVELEESDEAVPTPPTRILDRERPASVSGFLSALGTGAFAAEESDHESDSAFEQHEDEVVSAGEVSVFQPYETSFGRYKLFPSTDPTPRLPQSVNRPVVPARYRSRYREHLDEPTSPTVAYVDKGKQRAEEPATGAVDTSPPKSDVSYPSDRILTPYKHFLQNGPPPGLEDRTSPQSSPSIRTRPSTSSMAPTIPISVSGYDDDQDLMLKRQDKITPRVIEAGRTHSLANDNDWLQRDKQGKFRSWSLFIVCTIIPFALLLLIFGVLDKTMAKRCGAHSRPTLVQKNVAKYVCVVEVIFWPTLAA